MAEALTNAASLQKAIDVWVLENGHPSGISETLFLGDNANGTGQLVVDLESGMDCSIDDGSRCGGKNFIYYAVCRSWGCEIWIDRVLNGNIQEQVYAISWFKRKGESWQSGECDYYPDDYPMGEKICKHLATQGFSPCEDC